MANIKNNSVSSNVSSKQKQKQLNKKAQKRIKTIHQLTNNPSKLINKASRKINEIITIRIEGVDNHDIEHILPKIMQDTIENIYLMPFRLLGKFGNKKTIL